MNVQIGKKPGKCTGSERESGENNAMVDKSGIKVKQGVTGDLRVDQTVSMVINLWTGEHAGQSGGHQGESFEEFAEIVTEGNHGCGSRALLSEPHIELNEKVISQMHRGDCEEIDGVCKAAKHIGLNVQCNCLNLKK